MSTRKAHPRNEWSVPCRDIAGRKRDLTVLAHSGQVVLVSPPGELAVLAPLEVGRLRAALRDAAVDASTAADDRTRRETDR